MNASCWKFSSYLGSNACCWYVRTFLYEKSFPGKSFLIDMNCATTFAMDENPFMIFMTNGKYKSELQMYISDVKHSVCYNELWKYTFYENRKTVKWEKKKNNFQFHFQIALCCFCNYLPSLWKKVGKEWSVYCLFASESVKGSTFEELSG